MKKDQIWVRICSQHCINTQVLTMHTQYVQRVSKQGWCHSKKSQIAEELYVVFVFLIPAPPLALPWLCKENVTWTLVILRCSRWLLLFRKLWLSQRQQFAICKYLFPVFSPQLSLRRLHESNGALCMVHFNRETLSQCEACRPFCLMTTAGHILKGVLSQSFNKTGLSQAERAST